MRGSVPNHIYYALKYSSLNRIASNQRNFLSEDSNDDINLNKNKTLKSKSYFSLKKIFEKPKNLKIGEKRWPKITNPKLPFSTFFHESPDSKRLKIKLTKPSKTLQEINTIKWLNKKYSDSVIEKSIHSILPKKQNKLKYKKEKEHDKRFRAMLDYLDSLKGPVGREKFIEINPKYLFNEKTFESILKLKEVFLEFDISGNQKMEFDEIVKMFNQNHIKAGKKDILNLFFKHKIIKREKDIMKLHLGFYQFINFALKKEQNFRNFMRKIKLDSNQKEKDELNNNTDKERIYLPMNFNLMLDYFIKKEKEKHTIKKIKNAFDILENDIKKENENDSENKYIEYSKLNDVVNTLNSKSKKTKTKYDHLKKSNRILNQNKDKNKLSEINIIDLFNEFINLFYLSYKNEENDTKKVDLIQKKLNTTYDKTGNFAQPKKIISISDNSMLTNSIYNVKNLKKFNTRKNPLKNNYSITEYNTNNNDDKLLTLIKNQMNRNFVNKTNMENLKKYHDINLAKSATLKQIKKEFEFDKLYMNKKYKRKSINIFMNERNRNNIHKNNIQTITPFQLKKIKIK